MTRIEAVTMICDAVGKRVSALSPSGSLLEDRVITFLNWAQVRIARFFDFPELSVLATTSTLIADTKRYPISSGTNDLGLERVKTIRSIRLIDGANSRKLDYWLYRKFDHHYPHPENYSSERPSIYTRDGNFLEFFKIPNNTYSLSIRYTQYPHELTSNAQVSDFLNKDQVLVTAGIFETYFALEEYNDAKIWYARLVGQLKDAVRAEGEPDWEPEAEPFGLPSYRSGTPWIDPYGGVNDPLSGYD